MIEGVEELSETKGVFREHRKFKSTNRLLDDVVEPGGLERECPQIVRARFGVRRHEFLVRQGAKAGKDVSKYNRAELMKAEYDDTPLAKEADELIRTFQADSAKRAGIFHHLITLPTYHTAALSTDNLAREYFGEQGMLGYVLGVQREEIRKGVPCVRHQNMSGSDIGDDHKEYFAGEAALKAGGVHNTMNQFA